MHGRRLQAVDSTAVTATFHDHLELASPRGTAVGVLFALCLEIEKISSRADMVVCCMCCMCYTWGGLSLLRVARGACWTQKTVPLAEWLLRSKAATAKSRCRLRERAAKCGWGVVGRGRGKTGSGAGARSWHYCHGQQTQARQAQYIAGLRRPKSRGHIAVQRQPGDGRSKNVWNENAQCMYWDIDASS